MDVRLAALKALVDIVQGELHSLLQSPLYIVFFILDVCIDEHSEGDMKFLLDIVENDISAVRYIVYIHNPHELPCLPHS